MAAEILLANITIMLIALANAEYDVAQYCQLVKTGTKLPSLSSCRNYYICQDNAKPTEASCSGSTAFSKNAQACIPEENSDCIYDVSNPCRNKHKQFAPSAKGCNWWNWCVNGVIAGDGTCTIGQVFDGTTGACVYGDCDNKLNEADVENVCQIMPDYQFFGDFKDCSAWHKCKGMNMQNGDCLGSLVFDTTSGMCLANDGNMCERTKDIVKNKASGPPKEACNDVNQIVGDTNVCSIYYTCKLSTNTPDTTYEWVAHTCSNQYFDVITKQCNDTFQARPYPGCDRCEFKSGNPYWTNDVDPTCSKYCTCRDGRKVGTTQRSCGLGNFFNEVGQYCILGDGTLNNYAINNGACQNYKCTEKRVCSLVSDDHDINSSTTSSNDSSSTDKATTDEATTAKATTDKTTTDETTTDKTSTTDKTTVKEDEKEVS